MNVASSVLDPNDHGSASVTGRAPGEQADPAAAQPQRMEQLDDEPGTCGARGADYNAKETARRLYVHPNTLTYRLRAIRRLLGGDPARGDLRLTVELALKLKDLPRLSAASGADAR